MNGNFEIDLDILEEFRAEVSKKLKQSVTTLLTEVKGELIGRERPSEKEASSAEEPTPEP